MAPVSVSIFCTNKTGRHYIVKSGTEHHKLTKNIHVIYMMFVVEYTDCIGRYTSNYHAITTATALHYKETTI
jgi:hypothetical protein